MTVQQIVDLGMWEKVCEYKCWDTWILNEGKINPAEAVDFDTEFKKEVSKYDVATPIMKDNMKLYSYSVDCETQWEGRFYGIVFAEDKDEAVRKIEGKYSWETRLEKVTHDNINLIDLKNFENACYEVGSHSE